MPKTDEEESAERIQAIARGRKSRRRTASRSTTEKKERELAATKIQVRFSGSASLPRKVSQNQVWKISRSLENRLEITIYPDKSRFHNGLG